MLQSAFWPTQKSLRYLQHPPCKSFYNILRLLLHNGDFFTILLQSQLYIYTHGTYQLNSLSCHYRGKEMRWPFPSIHMNFAVLSGVKDIKHRVITYITWLIYICFCHSKKIIYTYIYIHIYICLLLLLKSSCDDPERTKIVWLACPGYYIYSSSCRMPQNWIHLVISNCYSEKSERWENMDQNWIHLVIYNCYSKKSERGENMDNRNKELLLSGDWKRAERY